MLFFEFLKTACVVSATLQLCYAYPFAVLNGTTQPFSLIVGRQSETNCADLSTGRGNGCIVELNIAKYLRKWLSIHRCFDQPFGSCFLRVSGFPGLDCTSISSTTCSPIQSSDLPPQDFYIAYNIYSLNIFFSTWSQAVGDASKAVGDQIGDILLTLNLPQNALKDDLSSSLQDITQIVQSKLQLTLTSVQSSAENFLAFVTVGNFSESPPSLLGATNDFTSALATYLTTLALTKNNIYVTMAKDTSVSNLVTNGTQLAYPIDCAQGLDPQGVCDAWWWSEKYNSSFGLANRNTPNEAFGPMISKLFSLGFTTGKLLFDNAYACRHPIGTQVDVNVTAAGVNTPCWSMIDVYVWDMACHVNPAAAGDEQVNCEFEGFGREPNFWEPSGTARNVPNSYLGPAIAQNVIKISRA